MLPDMGTLSTQLMLFLLADLQEDLDTIDRMIADGEARYDKWRHPDPYIGKS